MDIRYLQTRRGAKPIYAGIRTGSQLLSSRRSWSAGALLVCAIARLTNLSALPIFTDETAYVRAGQLVARNGTLFAQLHYGHPPLFSFLEAVVMKTGLWEPSVAGRVTSAMIGLVTCTVVMCCARELGNRSLVPMVGWAYALCPFAIFVERMALMDGPMALWGALALLLTLRLLRPGNQTLSSRLAILLGLAIGCGLLTRVQALCFELYPLLLALHVGRRERLRAFVVPVLISLTMLGFVLLVPGDNNVVAALKQHAGIHDAARTVLAQVAAVASWGIVYFTPLGCALCLLGLVRAFRQDRRWRIVALSCFIPALLYTAVPQTFYSSRYLFFVTPLAVLLVGLGTATLLQWLQRTVPARWSVYLLVMLLVLPAATQDTLLVTNPARAIFVPFDRYSYVEGWPSGYGFADTVALLRRAARGQPVVIGCSIINPPGDALWTALGSTGDIAIVPFDLGQANADRAFAQQHPHAFIVLDRESVRAEGTHSLMPGVSAREIARYWKPGHRAAYIVLQLTTSR